VLNIVSKSIITKVDTMRNFDAMSDKFNVDTICS